MAQESANESDTISTPSSTPVPKNDNTRKIFKIIVVGDSNVGKTCLSYRFCDGEFFGATEATIGVDFRSRTLNLDGENIVLQLWDTAGQERFRETMVRHYYRNAHAVLFVYDMTNMNSFNSMAKWILECERNCPEGIVRMLVGNKCDVKAVVPTEMAQQFADQFNMPHFETSAKMDSLHNNVDAIFTTLAYKLKNHKSFLPDNNIVVPTSKGNNSTSASKRCCSRR